MAQLPRPVSPDKVAAIEADLYADTIHFPHFEFVQFYGWHWPSFSSASARIEELVIELPKPCASENEVGDRCHW